MVDKGGKYQVVAAFRKAPGERPTYQEPAPIRRPSNRERPPKRTLTPPESDVSLAEEPPKPVIPPTRPEDSVHQEDHTPRIYTEETVVSWPEFFLSNSFA